MFKDKNDVRHVLLCKMNVRYIGGKLLTQGPVVVIDMLSTS